MSLFTSQTLRVDSPADDVAVLWLDLANRPVNVFTRQALADLDAALDRVAAEPSVRVLVVRSAKKGGFCAGADLHEFAAIRTAEDAVATSGAGQRLFDKLAGLRVPTIAVIHGPCVGGGLELALACDYRLVVDQPTTMLGLPEVERGLIPGWGGTQRLPRVVGLERSLQMILGTRRLAAREALRWHLADALAPTEQITAAELGSLVAGALAEGKRPRKGLPLHNWRQYLLDSNALGRKLVLGGAGRIMRKRTPDDMPAPGEALEAVRVGVTQGMEAGLAREREAIGRLAVSPACRNLVNLFFASEQARKLPAEAKEAVARKVRRVGVVGAGTMGAGIAQLAALRGAEIVLQEADADALGKGVFRVQALVEKAVERRILTPAEAADKLKTVKGTINWEGFDAADLVVEAVVEDLEAKRAVFRELEKHTRPDAVLATNTSSLPVAQLQEGLAHPERVAGLHFFNPVHKMHLVEVVHAPATAGWVTDLLMQWAVVLGKVPVRVKDSPGFLVNRILTPYLNEGVLLVAEGMDIAAVDGVMHRFGMPMGPLEVLDQVGLDVASHVARTLQPAYGDRFPANPGLELMRQNGWQGRKNGWGFYRYAGKKPRVNPAATVLLRDSATSPNAALFQALPPAARLQQARDRLVLLMVNEAAACLAEGVAADAGTIDLAMVLGTGWAPHRGGPLRYAADRGVDEVVRTLAELARRLGKRFEPHPALAGLRT
jgi:3-hydroxyacyl-CoA dehydrogenase/enoyl-CoA hydratase/3-hydroxybutyryl-CoA epimerase